MGVASRIRPLHPPVTTHPSAVIEKGGVGRKRTDLEVIAITLSEEAQGREGVKHRRKCPSIQDYANDRTEGGFLLSSLLPCFPLGQFFRRPTLLYLFLFIRSSRSGTKKIRTIGNFGVSFRRFSTLSPFLSFSLFLTILFFCNFLLYSFVALNLLSLPLQCQAAVSLEDFR